MKFEFATPALGREPYRTAEVDADISRVKIKLNRKYFSHEAEQRPLEYPLDELLFIHRLVREGCGVEVHACGLVDKDSKGRLFIGHSGAGKSTTSKLWEAKGAFVLSDDRIILRMEKGELKMYGTPWHGDARQSASASAAVHAIYLLEQAPQNRLTRMTPAETAIETFARSFLPFHGHAGIHAALTFLDTAFASVPAYRFEFLPDYSAVEHAARV
jgi:hypothetical protein